MKRYKIGSKPLGKGTFGVVYEGTDKNDPQVKIAVKVLNKKGM